MVFKVQLILDSQIITLDNVVFSLSYTFTSEHVDCVIDTVTTTVEKVGKEEKQLIVVGVVMCVLYLLFCRP